mmetsp:Transcript_39567/g.58252  ORF Transcript_39567/g.58252 Transcript_39567/m.58252 type:complete len:83 (-) Transcript_39567:718-966(-)
MARMAANLNPIPGVNMEEEGGVRLGASGRDDSTSSHDTPSCPSTISPGMLAAGDKVIKPMSACIPVAGSRNPGNGECAGRRY